MTYIYIYIYIYIQYIYIYIYIYTYDMYIYIYINIYTIYIYICTYSNGTLRGAPDDILQKSHHFSIDNRKRLLSWLLRNFISLNIFVYICTYAYNYVVGSLSSMAFGCVCVCVSTFSVAAPCAATRQNFSKHHFTFDFELKLGSLLDSPLEVIMYTNTHRAVGC